MKILVNGSPVNVEAAVRAAVKNQVEDINRKVIARGPQAANALRSAEMEVLKGQRSGRRYRKYPFRTYYTASAPGEPPARRFGNLNRHWDKRAESKSTSSGVEVVAVLESQERYAAYLESGTSKIAARPFVDKIKEKAQPEIEKIYREPYT